jgi:hypothetical protein
VHRVSQRPDVQPLRFTPFEVHEAPACPGIYAWYVQVPLEPDDWRPNIMNGQDRASPDFIEAVLRYGDYFRPERVELTGQATYGTRWAGEIAGSQLADLVSVEREGTGGVPGTSRLHETAEDLQARRIVLHLLRSALPVFAAPIYIGVTRSLRSRLQDHLADFHTTRTYLKDRQERADALRERGPTFGVRLAAANIDLNHLLIYALPLDTQGVGAAQTRAAAEVAEWTLQRIFRPVFGKD